MKIKKHKKKKNVVASTEARLGTKLRFFEKYLDENNFLIYVVLLSLIILSIIPISRYFSIGSFNFPPSDIPYYHSRISSYETASFPNLFLSGRDLLIFGGRPYYANLYDITIAILSIFLPVSMAFLFFSIFCGISSILLFSLILKRFDASLLRRFVICTMLVVSPIFIYTFSVPTSATLSILVVLLATYLFMQDNKNLVYLSFIISFVVPSFGMFAAIFLFVAIFYYYTTINSNEKKNFVLINVLIVLGIMVVSSLFVFLPQISLFSNYEFILLNPLARFMSDLGGIVGFGAFNILLMFFGAAVLWGGRNKYNYLMFSFVLAAFIFSFYVDSSVNIYLNFFVIVLAGYGFLNILKFKWSVGLVKSLTIIIIMCGLMFSTLSYLNRVSDMSPSKEHIDALNFLKEYQKNKYSGYQNNFNNSNLRQPVVLSHYSDSLFIQSYGFITVTDTLVATYPSEIRLNETNFLFQSRKLAPTKEILDKYDVSYIMVTRDMKKGLVWSKEDQGLLFILNNDPKEFKRIYFSKDFEIWEYVPQK